MNVVPGPDDTDAPSWLETVRRRIAGWRDAGIGPGWVAAVSGGSDSVGLLRALHRLREELDLQLSVACLDHGLRGEASREDARFVADLAESLGLPCDLGTWSPSRTSHFEADARAARLSWLAEVARSRGARAVAFGHTCDDQAETILHRIVRGAGLRGLAGIPHRRRLAPGVDLVRPLLQVSREQLRDELARLGQGYREDATNEDVNYTRARIRHDLIPSLQAGYNPRVVAAILRLGELAGEQRRMMDRFTAVLETSIVRESGPERIVFDREAVRTIAPPLLTEVIRRVWRDEGWPERSMTAQRWRRLTHCIRSGVATNHAGAGVTVQVETKVVVLDRTRRPPEPASIVEPVLLTGPGVCQVPWAGACLEAVESETAYADEVIDLDRTKFPLTVRTPAPGDRFKPLGMNGRRQRLVEFLRLAGVPREDRAERPVVADCEGIIWVVGLRISERVRTTETTTRRLSLTWQAEAGMKTASAPPSVCG